MSLDDLTAIWNQWLFLYPENITRVPREQGNGETIPLKHGSDPELAEKIFERSLEVTKLPLVLVRRNGELLFNDTAKEFEIVEEVTDAVELSIAEGYFERLPVCILLTNSLRTLLETIPELRKSGRFEVVGLKASTLPDKNDPSRRM